jgi:heme/copper-type cytochrome/quinol oxidase subunit 2
MEKKDWIILLIIFIILGIATYFALNTLEGEHKSVLNYISIIGSAITIFGFFITIYQQFKIQSVSKQIKSNLEDYQRQVVRNLFNWQFEKVIRHCKKLTP